MSTGASRSESPAGDRGRMRTLAPTVILDVVGPLVAYYSLRSAGLPAVGALILSGALPVLSIALGFVRHRRVDAIGILVLIGIAVGSAIGVATGSAHLVLLDGIVPTAVFGAVCVGSLRAKRPMIYRFALETIGADTPKGRDFADRWRYPGFRHAFRVITVVWGVSYLAAAAAQGIIIETATTGTAQASSKLMPPAVAALIVIWNVSYAKRSRREGELAARAARARGEPPPPMPA
jgi:uncharacterized membrane protein